MATDYNLLRLRAGGDAAELDRILQAEMREKYAAKLPETLGCPAFRFPTHLSGEQCSGDALAGRHALLVEPDQSVIDLTAGLGIDAFHLAHRAAHVTAVELDPAVAAALRENAAALGLTNISVVNAEAIGWLCESGATADVIFTDPSRRGAGGRRLYSLSDCRPDVIAALPLLRSRCRRLVVKASPMLDVSTTMHEFGGDADIMIYGNRGECKELTAVVPGTGIISVIDEEYPPFSFTAAQEAAAEVEYGLPAEGEILMRPSAALVKAGCFKLVAAHRHLRKIAPNVHLYTGEKPAADFPGSAWRIDAVIPFSKRAKRLVDAAEGWDVAVRDFVMGAEDLRRLLGITRGGEGKRCIYGIRARHEKLLLLTSRVK